MLPLLVVVRSLAGEPAAEDPLWKGFSIARPFEDLTYQETGEFSPPEQAGVLLRWGQTRSSGEVLALPFSNEAPKCLGTDWYCDLFLPGRTPKDVRMSPIRCVEPVLPPGLDAIPEYVAHKKKYPSAVFRADRRWSVDLSGDGKPEALTAVEVIWKYPPGYEAVYPEDPEMGREWWLVEEASGRVSVMQTADYGFRVTNVFQLVGQPEIFVDFWEGDGGAWDRYLSTRDPRIFKHLCGGNG